MFAIILIFILNTTFVRTQNMGPYRADLQSIHLCKDIPHHKWAYEAPYFIEQYENGSGRKLVRWNLTMPKSDGPIMGHIRLYWLKNKTFQKVYEYDGLLCHQVVMKAVFKHAKFDVDGKKCRFVKGHYSVEAQDPDEYLHLMTRVFQYGTFKVRLWYSVPAGIFNGREFIATSRPAKLKTLLKHSINT